MSWAVIQTGTQAVIGSGTSISPTCAASTGSAGHPHLLIAVLLSSSKNAWGAMPAGWTLGPDQTNGTSTTFNASHSSIAYMVDTTGGVTGATFTTSGTGANLKAAIAEYDPGSGVTSIVLNAVGSGIAGLVSSCTIATGTAAAAGDLVVSTFCETFGTFPTVPSPVLPIQDTGPYTYRTGGIVQNSNPGSILRPLIVSSTVWPENISSTIIQNGIPTFAITWTDPPGFTKLVSDQSASGGKHQYSAYELSAPSNATVSITATSTVASTNANAWTGVAATFTAVVPITQGLVGAQIDPNQFNPSGKTMSQDISSWQTYTSRNLTVRRQDFTTIPAAITSDLQNDVTAGRKVCMTFKPAFNPPSSTDLGALNTFLSSCKNAGLMADVCLFVDPPSITNMTAALYIAAIQFYSSTIRQYYPLVFVISAYNAQINNGASYYPGDSQVDKVATTLYGMRYFSGQAIRLDSAAAIADGAVPPKPFGIWGFNISISSPPGLVGSTVNENMFPTGTTSTQAIQQWNSVVGRTDGVGKIFINTTGSYPTSPTPHMNGYINTNTGVVLCYKPTFTLGATAAPFGFVTAEKAALTASINALLAAGMKIRGVCLYSECQAADKQLSAACFVAMYQFFYSSVSSTGVSMVYIALANSGVNQATNTQLWQSYYPGDSFVDIVGVDFYCTAYQGNIRIDTCAAVADAANPPKPFGLYEIGVAAGNPVSPPVESTFSAYMSYIQTLMVNRLNAGKTNADVAWWDGSMGNESASTPNCIVPGTSSTLSYKANIISTYYPNLYDALTPNITNFTTAQVNTFFGYIQSYFTTRVSTSKVNADIILDNGSGPLTSPPIITGDIRISLYDSIFDALNFGGTGSASLVGQFNITLSDVGSLITSQGIVGSSSFIFTVTASLSGVTPSLPAPGPVSFPSYATPVYSYFTTDLVTNTPLGEIPVTQVTLDSQLNSAGNMQAVGNLDDPRISNNDFIARTIPGRTAFWAYRNNQIVWGGIIWSRSWLSKGKQFQFSGQTFESYALKRFPRSVWGTSLVKFNEGQCAIINDLWNSLQSVSGGNIGVLLSTLPTSDIVRQLNVNAYDLSTSFDDLIQSILVFSDGPDYTIQWNQDSNGLPVKQLAVAPRIGRAVGQTNLLVDYPGSLVDYQYIENASSGANQWWAVGDGVDAAATVGEATSQASLTSGWPLLEAVNSYPGVTDQSTINSHASSDLTSLPMPLVTHAADIFGAAQPNFGTYQMGDYVLANVIDSRFMSGQMFTVRVVGWTIVPSDNQNGVEVITLVFDEPTGSGT